MLGTGVVAIVATAGVGWLSITAALVSSLDALTWTSVTMLVVVGVWTYTARYAAENVADAAEAVVDDGRAEEVREQPVYATLGVPTGVTLFRGVLVAGIAGVGGVAAIGGGVATVGTGTELWAWGAAVAYGLAAALDSVDGFLARRLERTTKLGARLDTAVDAFGLLVAPLAGVVLGELPWWYLSVGVARYAFVAGLWWRERTGRPTYSLPHRVSRRVLAGLQMAVVPVALAPGVGDAWIPFVAGVAAGGLLAGFGRDWLYVSGRIEPELRGRQDISARD
ncbi:CDP-alcohol phosphatidyltransferase family protein [Haloferax sp. DFSO52]|uniref:CDP-alcohol phosphatidyltransferase family protein n=1 Tax=Haloferax sp. DFSO52 TaxID=3388505 RepID=UPI003A86AEE0